jgi:STE24 endopeptidase
VPAVILLLVGVVLLAVATLRWVPAQEVPVVTDADVARDFTVEERRRERVFRRRVRPWGLASVALDVAVPTVLTLTGAVSGLVARVAGPWWWQVVVASSLVLVVTRALTLPGAVVVRRVSLEHGLAAGPWSRWWRDVALAFVLAWVLGTAALVGWVAAARWWPDGWWIVVAVVAGLLVVLLSFLVPVVIEPLFARFTPMPGGVLRDRLLALAAADGILVGDVLVADASRRSTALNAYVSGLGATRRIVVHDTLLGRGRDDEAAAVVAHELGHVAAHDVRTGTILGAGGAVLAVAAVSLALSAETLRDLVHVTVAGDPAVVGFLLAAGAWAGLLGAPVQNAVSRRIERRADQHCLALTADPATVARMHRSLAITNIAPLRPPRVLHLWFGTHPTSPERIATARRWAVEHGAPAPGDLVAR